MNYMETIRQYQTLTFEEEQELARRAEQGDMGARDKLIHANLRLVVKIAHEYKNIPSVQFDDLVQEGKVGLMNAVRNFRAGRGARLETFARQYVHGNIKLYLSHMAGAVSMSKGTYTRDSNVRKMNRQLGNDASIDTLAKKCHICRRDVVKTALQGRYSQSLNAPIKDGESCTGLDFLEAKQTESCVERIIKDESMKAMMDALKSLGDKERRIIEGLYGLDGLNRLKLNQLGDTFGISAERVRQMKNEALKKLRKILEAETTR